MLSDHERDAQAELARAALRIDPGDEDTVDERGEPRPGRVRRLLAWWGRSRQPLDVGHGSDCRCAECEADRADIRA